MNRRAPVDPVIIHVQVKKGLSVDWENWSIPGLQIVNVCGFLLLSRGLFSNNYPPAKFRTKIFLDADWVCQELCIQFMTTARIVSGGTRLLYNHFARPTSQRMRRMQCRNVITPTTSFGPFSSRAPPPVKRNFEHYLPFLLSCHWCPARMPSENQSTLPEYIPTDLKYVGLAT